MKYCQIKSNFISIAPFIQNLQDKVLNNTMKIQQRIQWEYNNTVKMNDNITIVLEIRDMVEQRSVYSTVEKGGCNTFFFCSAAEKQQYRTEEALKKYNN